MINNNKKDLENRILLPLVDRAVGFLKEDMGIDVSSEKVEIMSPKKVELKKNTAMIGTGGSIQVLITIGYDDELLSKITDAFLDGEEVDDEEMEEVQESVSCEFVNTIVGNALKNPVDGTTLSITPPILISEAKSLFKQKDSKIAVVTLNTEFGEMLLTTIGPKDSFSQELNFKEL